MKTVLAFLLAFLPTFAARAAESGESIGIGSNLCAQYTKDRSDVPASAEQVYWPWAMGMMSGLNFASIANNKYFRDLTGDQDLFQRAILAYCQTHPLASYMGAILDLYISLPLKKASAN
jgi:hypothetical protein